MVPFQTATQPVVPNGVPVATADADADEDWTLRAEKAIARYMVDFLCYYCAESQAAHCYLITLGPARTAVQNQWKSLTSNDEIAEMLKDPMAHVEEIHEIYKLDKNERRLEKVELPENREEVHRRPIYLHGIYFIHVTLSTIPYEKTLDALFMTTFHLCNISNELVQAVPEVTIRASAEVAELFGFPYVHFPIALTAILPTMFTDGSLKITAFYDVPDEGQLRKKELLVVQKQEKKVKKESENPDPFANLPEDPDQMFEEPADPVKFLAEEYEKLDLNPLPDKDLHFMNTLVVAKQPAAQFNPVHQSLSVFSLNTHSEFTVVAVVENESTSTDLLDHVFNNLSLFASTCLAIRTLKKFQIIIVNTVKHDVKFDYTNAAHKKIKQPTPGNAELELSRTVRKALEEYISSPSTIWECRNPNGPQCQFAVFEHNMKLKEPEEDPLPPPKYSYRVPKR